MKKGIFCNSIINKIDISNKSIFKLKKKHSEECNDLFKTHINNLNEKNIFKYNDFVDKCIQYLDNIEFYNKKEIVIELKKIYLSNKFSFILKDYTISIILFKKKRYII